MIFVIKIKCKQDLYIILILYLLSKPNASSCSIIWIPEAESIILWFKRVFFSNSFMCIKFGSRTAPPPFLKKNYGFVFVNFDCITRRYFDFSSLTMFTLCILFTTFATNTWGMCEGASKQTPELKFLPRQDRPPPPPPPPSVHPPPTTNHFLFFCFHFLLYKKI